MLDFVQLRQAAAVSNVMARLASAAPLIPSVDLAGLADEVSCWTENSSSGCELDSVAEPRILLLHLLSHSHRRQCLQNLLCCHAYDRSKMALVLVRLADLRLCRRRSRDCRDKKTTQLDLFPHYWLAEPESLKALPW